MDAKRANQVVIYTDGACNPNPGPGAWAAVLLFSERAPQELVGTVPFATNNKMELQAAIEALKSLSRPHRVRLVTDSRYLQRGVTEWLPAWQCRGWRTTSSREVKNQDLWRALALQLERHQVEWAWTKGHAESKWNERANYLAQSAVPKAALPLDDRDAIHVFTAASYLGEVKRGGWGVVLKYGDHSRSLYGSERETSSNRMHLLAAIAGLGAIRQPLRVHVYTASDYLKDGAAVWMKNWATNGWRTRDGSPVVHQELWARLSKLSQGRDIQWHVAPKPDASLEMKSAKEAATKAALHA